jgi:hypothetical protein
MTLNTIVSTIAAGFLFPFLISMMWGKMVEAWGPIGGWMAAGFIVGTTWALNHGIGMLWQSGASWIDMAWAAGTGLMLADLFAGKKFNTTTVLAGILGGIIGGFILSTVL